MSGYCPAGHPSSEDDYCSVCGAAMRAAPVAAPQAAPVAPRSGSTSASVCPSCGEPREDPGARFCEVCRFDFIAGKPGPPPVGRSTSPAPPPRAPAAPVAPPPPSPAPAAPPARGWELVVAVDASLDTEPDPDHPCPAGQPERVIAIDKPELLVGRHDEHRDIHPELSLQDPGCSRRHAKFVLEPDGRVALQDLASTNGTALNGHDVKSGTRVPLQAGDVVTLGRWTRIAVRERA